MQITTIFKRDAGPGADDARNPQSGIRNPQLDGSPLLAAALLLAVTMASTACHRSAGAEGEEAKGEQAVAEVTVAKVMRQPISSTLQISGTIAALPNRDVKISSQVAGRVAEMLVIEGGAVKQGDVVARIDPVQQRDQLRQAEAAVAQAKAQLENAQQSLKRNETLFQRGIAAAKEVEDARMQVRVAEATLHQANAGVQLARLQVTRTDVHSPLSGTVVKRFVSTGEQVDGSAAQPLYQVAELSEVELFANIPGAYLGQIHPGLALSLSSDAFPGRQFPAKVVAILPSVDPATNVGIVRIRLANLSMDSHPIHIHGVTPRITGASGGPIPDSAQQPASTVNVPPGDTRDMVFLADNPGDWALHCHKTHHTMSGMAHGLPNVIGMDASEADRKIRQLLPQYMTMGQGGMGGMRMPSQVPNFIGMGGGEGPFGFVDMSGMFTVIKVRDGITGYQDPGWYRHPPGTVAWRVAPAQKTQRK